MPECCDCRGPNTFSARDAERDLKRYRDKGPDKTTRALIDALKARGVKGAALLDIGGGIGAIQLELLPAGVAHATAVDASEPYVHAARAEASRRGYAERTDAKLGDFVQLARVIEPADIVTLDRVVCCYPDPEALLGAAAAHARRVVGLVYPREAWWNGIASRVMNAFARLTRDRTRWYHYPEARVNGILARAGFVPRPVTRDLIWQVVLFERATTLG